MIPVEDWPAESPPPRYATPASPGASHRLDDYRAMAGRLGFVLMPWQEHVVRVATEIDDEGLPRYNDITVTVPRQNGKTAMVLLTILINLKRRGVQGAFVSSALPLATNLFRDVLWPKILESGLADEMELKIFLGNAAPRLSSSMYGSVCHLLSGSKQAGHGLTIGYAICDEVWAYRDNRHRAALKPAMATYPDQQMWSVSTAGVSDAESPYMWARVSALRAEVAAGRSSGACYFEWSAPPDCDHRDPAVWRASLPALGRTITERVVRSDLESPLETDDDFRRASLNIWLHESDDGDIGVFPAAQWDAVSSPANVIPAMYDGPVWLGIDCPPSLSHAAFAMSNGEVVTLIRYESWVGNSDPGDPENTKQWVPEYLARVLAAADVRQIVVMTYAMKNHVEALLADRREDDKLVYADTPWLGASCARFQQDVMMASVRVSQHRALTKAVRSAEPKEIIERGWVYRHLEHRSNVDISSLWAVTMAWQAAVVGLREPQVAMPVLI